MGSLLSVETSWLAPCEQFFKKNMKSIIFFFFGLFLAIPQNKSHQTVLAFGNKTKRGAGELLTLLESARCPRRSPFSAEPGTFLSSLVSEFRGTFVCSSATLSAREQQRSVIQSST